MGIKLLIFLLFNIICVISSVEEEIVIRIIGGMEEARNLAAEMGFLYKGPVSMEFFLILSDVLIEMWMIPSATINLTK